MSKGLEEARRLLSRGRNLMTLREARENACLSLDEAAEKIDVTVSRLKGWEINCGRTDTYLFLKLLQLYGTSSSHVYAGRETDLLAARREVNMLKSEVIRAEDIVALLKKMGRDTTVLEDYLEGLSKCWEAETKNALAIGVAKALETSVM
ncbi:helix-turn-helix transcriptional regulator [Paenibacillus odorifer]|uniref:HTH cro/C1-type domain-containing protein n=1 Tax=Paenibacillus odorifer TaxID=189426 RepID=A0A1R0Y5E3_9BACL|nr:helix-turn-helix transcriptional regulator [Paenibacillus odorifer]OMD42567.1 hypothetical protein BSK52_07090 [Paenibacillus odorifer]